MDNMELSFDSQLIPPYKGELVNLLVSGEEREELIRKANHLASVQLSPRSLCDIELLATGAFSPLHRFMGEGRLRPSFGRNATSGRNAFSYPDHLACSGTASSSGRTIALRSPKNELIAIMLIEEVFEWSHTTRSAHRFLERRMLVILWSRRWAHGVSFTFPDL